MLLNSCINVIFLVWHFGLNFDQCTLWMHQCIDQCWLC
jgi:hypothetical protein